jgi:Bifunctional DNA primase/polymerase, N-terminal
MNPAEYQRSLASREGTGALPCVPVCWPVNEHCGCGRGHRDKAIGKAPLVRWAALIDRPPTASQMVAWAARWPACNWAVLVEPARWLLLDLDNDAALGEATGLGMPPAPCWWTGRGQVYVYEAPAAVTGRRTTKRGTSKAIDVLAGGIAILPPSRHRHGADYRWRVPLDVQPPGPAPPWAVQMLLETTEPVSAAPAAKAGIPGSEQAEPVTRSTATTAGLPPSLVTLLERGCAADPARYPSRSEALFSALQRLIGLGLADDEIAALILREGHAIGDKPRALGRAGARWLAGELHRARRKHGRQEVGR